MAGVTQGTMYPKPQSRHLRSSVGLPSVLRPRLSNSRPRATQLARFQLYRTSLRVRPFVHVWHSKLISRPGWTHTGMTAGSSPTKPPGAWTAEQTVDYMLDKVFEDGDFYVICPDNETSSVSSARKGAFRKLMS